MTDVKTYLMIVMISDSKNTTEYNFTLTVTNQPPKLTSSIKTPIFVSFGKSIIYDLPTSIDPEGLPYSTTIIRGPSYVTQLSATQLRIFPTNCLTDFGDQ